MYSSKLHFKRVMVYYTLWFDPSDFDHIPMFVTVGPVATIVYLELYGELNKLGFNFCADYVSYLTFLPLVTLTLSQGQRKSNLLVPGLCPTLS